MTYLGFIKAYLMDANITSSDLKNIRKTLSSITSIETQDFKILVPFLQKRTVKKEELILTQGTICKNIFFLLNGFVRMYYLDHAGNEINYRFTDSGNFFVDFQSFLTQQPSRYYWEAMEETELLQIPYSSVQQIYSASPVWNNFGRLIAEHVYTQLNERVEMLLFMTPEERYILILKSNPDLIQKVSLFHLSSYIGVKPESLSRIRKRLSRKKTS